MMPDVGSTKTHVTATTIMIMKCRCSKPRPHATAGQARRGARRELAAAPGGAAHRVGVDVLYLVDLDHAYGHIDEDGGYVGQREELEVRQEDQGQGDNPRRADDAGHTGRRAALDVEGSAGQRRRGGDPAEYAGDDVGEGQCEHFLPLIEFGLGHAIGDPE